jgi:hypothetical protein
MVLLRVLLPVRPLPLLLEDLGLLSSTSSKKQSAFEERVSNEINKAF